MRLCFLELPADERRLTIEQRHLAVLSVSRNSSIASVSSPW